MTKQQEEKKDCLKAFVEPALRQIVDNDEIATLLMRPYREVAIGTTLLTPVLLRWIQNEDE